MINITKCVLYYFGCSVVFRLMDSLAFFMICNFVHNNSKDIIFNKCKSINCIIYIRTFNYFVNKFFFVKSFSGVENNSI